MSDSPDPLELIAVSIGKIEEHANHQSGYTKQLNDAFLTHNATTNTKLDNLQGVMMRLIFVLVGGVLAFAGVKVFT